MRLGYSIRSDLTHSREARPSVRKRLNDNAFGVYRPLSADSATLVQATLEGAKKEIDSYMASKNIEAPTVVIPKDHAVTYIERRDVMKALRNGLLRNLELRRMKTNVDNHNYNAHSILEIGIDGFDWFGGNDRKFAGRIAVGTNVELAEDTEVIEGLFHDAGAGVLEATEPNHISLCRYRVSRNDHLAAIHRKEIGRIVGQHFSESEIGSLTLGPLVVGQSYTEQLDIAA